MGKNFFIKINFVLILVLLISVVSAEPIITLQYDVNIYDQATLESFQIGEGTEWFPNENGDYSIELISENGSSLYIKHFQVGFFNPNQLDSEKTSIYLRVPWDKDTKKVILKKNEFPLNEFVLTKEIIQTRYTSKQHKEILNELEQDKANLNRPIPQIPLTTRDYTLIIVLILISILIVGISTKLSKNRH